MSACFQVCVAVAAERRTAKRLAADEGGGGEDMPQVSQAPSFSKFAPRMILVPQLAPPRQLLTCPRFIKVLDYVAQKAEMFELEQVVIFNC